MKRILILLLTACMIAAAFVGCAQKPGFGSSSADTNGNGLRDDVELEILEYVSDEKVNPDDWIIRYYGTYHGAVALSIINKNSITTGVVTDVTIAGYVFSFGNRGRIIVWHTDETYSLKEAYDMGILTVEDIGTIHALKYELQGQ